MQESKVKEEVVEDYFIRRVKETGGVTRKLKFIGWRGAPDRACWWPGRKWGLVIVELKRPKGGLLSGHQLKLHAELLSSGEAVYLLWTKGMVDDFINLHAGDHKP